MTQGHLYYSNVKGINFQRGYLVKYRVKHSPNLVNINFHVNCLHLEVYENMFYLDIFGGYSSVSPYMYLYILFHVQCTLYTKYTPHSLVYLKAYFRKAFMIIFFSKQITSRWLFFWTYKRKHNSLFNLKLSSL